MIGRISGDVVAAEDGVLLIDVLGVGYEVAVTQSTLERLSAAKTAVELFTHQAVRDDAITLFGFPSLEERSLFRLLIKVSGVGPRVAMAMLGFLSAEALTRCIADGETGLLTKVPGVGKRTAERVIVELKDRLDAFPIGARESAGAVAEDHAVEDAVRALVGLGWRAAEVRDVVADAHVDGESTEELIRAALRRLGSEA